MGEVVNFRPYFINVFLAVFPIPLFVNIMGFGFIVSVTAKILGFDFGHCTKKSYFSVCGVVPFLHFLPFHGVGSCSGFSQFGFIFLDPFLFRF